jgi:hypothetical protein
VRFFDGSVQLGLVVRMSVKIGVKNSLENEHGETQLFGGGDGCLLRNALFIHIGQRYSRATGGRSGQKSTKTILTD